MLAESNPYSPSALSKSETTPKKLLRRVINSSLPSAASICSRKVTKITKGTLGAFSASNFRNADIAVAFVSELIRKTSVPKESMRANETGK